MRVLLVLLLMSSPLIAIVPSVAAESGACTVVESWPAPVEVTEPMSCGFPCEAGRGWITMRMEVTGGHIEASCGGSEGAGLYTGPVSTCFASGPIPGLNGCTGMAGATFDYADTGVCTFYPAPDVPTFVYSASCEASLR